MFSSIHPLNLHTGLIFPSGNAVYAASARSARPFHPVPPQFTTIHVVLLIKPKRHDSPFDQQVKWFLFLDKNGFAGVYSLARRIGAVAFFDENRTDQVSIGR
jgi:hypothetical protein